MAYAIAMIEPAERKRAIAYCGISWTCLFFGPFPALFRGHLFGFVGMMLIDIATLGLSLPVFSFIYNAWHYHSLLARGYRPLRQVAAEESAALWSAPQAATEPLLRPRPARVELPTPLALERVERSYFRRRG